MKNKKELKDEAFEIFSKKLKSLYAKYPVPPGTLDGGPPKEEENKLRDELLAKWKEIELYHIRN